jgi:HEAT repeat protein
MLISAKPRNLEASFRDLGSERADVRKSAVLDVVRHASDDKALRDRALAALSPLLEDQAPDVRAAAIVALSDLKATELLPKILLAVEDDDGYVRQMALTCLGELGDARATGRVRRATQDPRPEVRYQGLIALSHLSGDAGELGAALERALSDDDCAVVHIALRIAEQRLDEGVSQEPKLVQKAQTLLAAKHPDVALCAAMFLAKQGHDDAKKQVLRAVRREYGAEGAPNAEEETAAVELVGALGLREAIPDLERRAFGLARFVRDTAPWAAKAALARLGHARAQQDILSALRHTNDETRARGIVAAGKARLKEARALVEGALGTPLGSLAQQALADIDGPANAPRASVGATEP